MNTDNIDLNNLSEIKKQLGVAEDNNDYIYVEGVGLAFETGKMDVEKLVRTLLTFESITGRANPMLWNDESKDEANKKER